MGPEPGGQRWCQGSRRAAGSGSRLWEVGPGPSLCWARTQPSPAAVSTLLPGTGVQGPRGSGPLLQPLSSCDPPKLARAGGAFPVLVPCQELFQSPLQSSPLPWRVQTWQSATTNLFC